MIDQSGETITKEILTMFNHLMTIATTHPNLLAVQRAKRILRLRYGITMPSRKAGRDPVWLTAHD